MFCTKCGNELREGAVFCEKCGNKVGIDTEPVNSTASDDFEPMEIQGRRTGDKVTDKIASSLCGQNIRTMRISMDDMLKLVKIHFIDKAETIEEKKKIVTACGGGSFLFGFGYHIVSKDGNYRIWSLNAPTRARSRINLLHPSDSSYVYLKDDIKGIAYAYFAFSIGKFKKAVKAMI